MPQQANVVLNDGQATPVAHTFVPYGSRAQPDKRIVSLWLDQSQSNLDSYWKLNEGYTPVNGNGMEKLQWIFDIPTLVTPSSGAPYRDYGTIGKIEMWAHKRALLAELKNAVALVKNFTASQYFYDAVTLRQPAY